MMHKKDRIAVCSRRREWWTGIGTRQIFVADDVRKFSMIRGLSASMLLSDDPSEGIIACADSDKMEMTLRRRAASRCDVRRTD